MTPREASPSPRPQARAAPQVATLPMEVQRRTAIAVIGELQEELGVWKRRAEASEQRVVQLDEENAQLRAKVASLEETVKALRKKLAQVRREGKRSAGPFRRNKRKQRRNKPGRKKGEGTFSHLDSAPESPDTTHVEVPAPGSCDCGGTLEFLQYEEVSNTDPPKEVRPHVTKFRMAVCRCHDCGATVRGRHPDVAPDQYGATAHRYGDRMMAVCHVLHYGMGIPQRAVPHVVEMLVGVKLTQSALNQDATRRSEAELNWEYTALRRSMKTEPVGHTDATGWRVDGEAAQMMVYTNEKSTVYDIQKNYRNEEIRDVFPSDYEGTLVGDGAKVFNAKKLSKVRQQKCLFHGLKMIREVHETQEGEAREFGEQLKGMLQQGIALWHDYHAGRTQEYRAKVADLEGRLAEHLRDRTMTDDDNRRLLKFFGEHHRKGNLTRFLHDPRVPPTNNRAELELRFLIPARKVSQCSKNERGAHARKVLTSLIRTEKRKMVNEQSENNKPYTDQRTLQAEERERHKLKGVDVPTKLPTGPSRPVAQVESQARQARSVGPSHPTLINRVTNLFRREKQILRTAKEVVDRILGSPRSRSP